MNLRCYMNTLAFDSLPTIREAGFDGVQFANRPTKDELSRCRSLGLGYAGSGRVNTPSEAFPLAAELSDDGCECATLHVGWGLEDDDEAFRLIESILEASERTQLPLYIETHRATICQDMWRTVGFVRRHPELRFNGDFSHWYAGQEMVYGGFEAKFNFIKPVIDRVRFIHGRIANPGCIQVPVQEGSTYLAHFEQLWTACFRAFLKTAKPDDSIIFAPELLAPEIYYARTFQGREETDRWMESLLLTDIARRCFNLSSSQSAQ